MTSLRNWLPLALLAVPLAAPLGCTTPKMAASEALGPELVLHSVPEGAAVTRAGQPAGKTPLILPVKRDSKLEFELTYPNTFPGKVSLDAPALFRAGGGEAWVPLKPDNMGQATGDLDASSAGDLTKAGLAMTKANRCPEAFQYFQRALALDPQLARVHRDQAKCYFKTKQHDRGVAELQQYLTMLPDAKDAKQVQALLDKATANTDFDLPVEKKPAEEK
jgi:tetratricopeptide (TPR) repeat protein